MDGRRTVRRLADEADVAAAAREARRLAVDCGLSGVEAQSIATAVSEVALNAIKYARGGEIELQAAERDGRVGLRIVVRDDGPGIADVDAALRDGVSSGGSLGLGLPGARRLMDDFSLESSGRGTVVAMARWEGGLLATETPAECAVHAGPGGTALVQPFRNGLLLGLAAGPRAEDVVRVWRTRPWHAPAQLAEGCLEELDSGERVGLALASVSGLDGRLAWLRAGGVGCVLLRSREIGEIALVPPTSPALSPSQSRPLRAATVDARRDDVLVMAAAALGSRELAELAGAPGAPGAPAHLVARFSRGTLEPRRPPVDPPAFRRRKDPAATTTMEGP
jgi:serine/threonine-protein kinase RsbT